MPADDAPHGAWLNAAQAAMVADEFRGCERRRILTAEGLVDLFLEAAGDLPAEQATSRQAAAAGVEAVCWAIGGTYLAMRAALQGFLAQNAGTESCTVCGAEGGAPCEASCDMAPLRAALALMPEEALAEVEHLTAERDRLRAALSTVRGKAETVRDAGPGEPGTYWAMVSIAQIAREALDASGAAADD